MQYWTDTVPAIMKSLLFIEDNPYDLDLAQIALGPYCEPCAMAIARDGEEALAYLRREGAWKHRLNDDPALDLLDLKLPKIDGLAVLQEIRRTPGISLPVVALTSSREPRDLRRCYEQGVNAYLVKPTDVSESKMLALVAPLLVAVEHVHWRGLADFARRVAE
ncbi:response regulator protein [Caballeronia temeraria]|uniref:Response regulator protein n=2 Tax=Caballeronia temeraria TaxID=1777137 RepID=A0A158DC33_9BURK|nr:response regulator protein [Caballeronia temeraria]